MKLNQINIKTQRMANFKIGQIVYVNIHYNQDFYSEHTIIDINTYLDKVYYKLESTGECNFILEVPEYKIKETKPEIIKEKKTFWNKFFGT
jgi:hypothetical protein